MGFPLCSARGAAAGPSVEWGAGLPGRVAETLRTGVVVPLFVSLVLGGLFERTSEGGSREHSATLSSPFLGPPGSLAFPSSSSFRWGAATSEDWQERASPTGESFITEMADRRLTGNVCHSGKADVSAKYAC